MTAAELTALRRGLGLAQTETAERVALTVAVERRNPMPAPASIRREALDLARLITEG